jgi:hypothetical protein
MTEEAAKEAFGMLVCASFGSERLTGKLKRDGTGWPRVPGLARWHECCFAIVVVDLIGVRARVAPACVRTGGAAPAGQEIAATTAAPTAITQMRSRTAPTAVDSNATVAGCPGRAGQLARGGRVAERAPGGDRIGDAL